MRRAPFYMLLLPALTACAGNDLLVQKQNSIEGRLNQLMQAQNSANARIAELSAQILELQGQLKKQRTAESSVEPEWVGLQTKLTAVGNRLDRLEADTAALRNRKIELVNNEADVLDSDEKVQAAYIRAFGLFSANNYQPAAEAFEHFIETYPESEHAANARFWLAECYFATGLFKKAIDGFTAVMEMKYPGNKASEAFLKTGLSWYGLNEPAKGEAVLRTLIEKYPESEAAGKAREKLAR